jgi:UDP-N-acetylglucosamine--N-acetylmuramyl-(pentapeptide) pyrophosphoryl-undecaprenol N-acetylglucosamine transferase
MERISLARFSKIAFVWGGTGWHVTPIVSLIHQHQSHRLKYIWIGWANSMEEKEAAREKVDFFSIALIKLVSITSPMTLLWPLYLIIGTFQARKILLREKPDLVFSKWWPGALSVVLASKLLMIPVWMHESDTKPTLVSQLIGALAERVFLGFKDGGVFFRESKCTLIWQIIHPDFHLPPKEFRYWKTTKSHILVACGSQWSKKIFESIINNCKYIDVEWIVLLGTLNQNFREQFQGFQNITLYDWIDPHTFASILRGTNLLITRGSATTLAESDLFAIKKVIIPLPSSSMQHQYFNARWYKENKDDILLEESNIKELPNIITKTLGADIIDQSMKRSNDFLR